MRSLCRFACLLRCASSCTHLWPRGDGRPNRTGCTPVTRRRFRKSVGKHRGITTTMAFQQQSLSCIGGQEAAAAQGTETVAAARVRSRTPLRRKRCSMPFQQRSLSCIGGQEAAAAAQTVPAAEAMSRTLPPPLFPLSRQASGGHYDDSRKSLFHCLTKWSMLVGLTTWSMLGGGVGGIVSKPGIHKPHMSKPGFA